MKRLLLTGLLLLAPLGTAGAQTPAAPAPEGSPVAAPATAAAPVAAPEAPAAFPPAPAVMAPAPAPAPGMGGAIAVPATPAAAPVAATPEAQPEPGMMTKVLANPITMMVLMFVVIYFMLIRPQSKKRKEQESWLTGLKVGDTVVTQAGIIGKIASLTDKIVKLEVAHGVQLRILRSQILGPASMIAEGPEAPQKSGK